MQILPTVRILRVEESQEGTFGVLTICSQVFCVTLELSDRLNKQEVSCIPAQQYMCKRIISPKFGETFEICDVPGRDHVLFHKGNRIIDTHGCIILAQHFGKLKGDRAVLNSGATFDSFMEIIEGYDTFSLTIKEDY